MQGLKKELSEKDELVKKYCSHIEILKKNVQAQNKQCKDLLRQLRGATSSKETSKLYENNDEDNDDCDAVVSFYFFPHKILINFLLINLKKNTTYKIKRAKILCLFRCRRVSFSS